MTKAEHAGPLRTRTLGIIITKIANMRPFMQSGTSDHPMYIVALFPFHCDRFGASLGGGDGGEGGALPQRCS